MITIGMESIAKSTQTQIQQIETNKQENLKILNEKFAAADTAKSSFGYIAILSLSILFGLFLFNDCIKIATFTFKMCTSHLNDARINKKAIYESRSDKKQHEQFESIYSKQLETRLESVYLRLVKSKYQKNNSLSSIQEV